jgi:DNA-binding MarR family transcriptional regulator
MPWGIEILKPLAELTYNDLIIMALCYEPCTIVDHHLFLQQRHHVHNVIRQIPRLVKMGLIERSKDTIALTAMGREVIDGATANLQNLKMLSILRAAGQVTFQTIMTNADLLTAMLRA